MQFASLFWMGAIVTVKSTNSREDLGLTTSGQVNSNSQAQHISWGHSISCVEVNLRVKPGSSEACPSSYPIQGQRITRIQGSYACLTYWKHEAGRYEANGTSVRASHLEGLWHKVYWTSWTKRPSCPCSIRLRRLERCQMVRILHIPGCTLLHWCVLPGRGIICIACKYIQRHYTHMVYLLSPASLWLPLQISTSQIPWQKITMPWARGLLQRVLRQCKRWPLGVRLVVPDQKGVKGTIHLQVCRLWHCSPCPAGWLYLGRLRWRPVLFRQLTQDLWVHKWCDLLWSWHRSLHAEHLYRIIRLPG